MIWIAECIKSFLLQNLLICFYEQTEIFWYNHISLNGSPITDINPDLSSHVETVCLLSKLKSDY